MVSNFYGHINLFMHLVLGWGFVFFSWCFDFGFVYGLLGFSFFYWAKVSVAVVLFWEEKNKFIEITPFAEFTVFFVLQFGFKIFFLID